MKKSKRYIKKQNNKPLINKKVLAKVIRESNICKHAIKELKLAGYGNGEGGPNDWMYQQVIEAVAVFASHGNSGNSAPWEINLVQRLCDWDIISPLKFTDDEWCQISSDGTCQNRRKGDVFKEPDGSIHYNGAFDKRPISRYNFDTKEWTDNKNPICWYGGLFEYKDNILTGVWTNSVCGHPQQGETFEQAVTRRCRFELGVEISDIAPGGADGVAEGDRAAVDVNAGRVETQIVHHRQRLSGESLIEFN